MNTNSSIALGTSDTDRSSFTISYEAEKKKANCFSRREFQLLSCVSFKKELKAKTKGYLTIVLPSLPQGRARLPQAERCTRFAKWKEKKLLIPSALSSPQLQVPIEESSSYIRKTIRIGKLMQNIYSKLVILDAVVFPPHTDSM